MTRSSASLVQWFSGSVVQWFCSSVACGYNQPQRASDPRLLYTCSAECERDPQPDATCAAPCPLAGPGCTQALRQPGFLPAWRHPPHQDRVAFWK